MTVVVIIYRRFHVQYDSKQALIYIDKLLPETIFVVRELLNSTNKYKKKKKKTTIDSTGQSSYLHIPNFENVAILDDDVIHVYGLELIEVFRKRDEMDGGSFVELKKIRIFIVPLPAQSR